MSNKLILIRGLPGSGKSTLAKKFKDYVHYETDMFFMDESGYNFDREKLTEAHAWCLSMTAASLSFGQNVVVANTFTRLWELQPYFDVAQQLAVSEVTVLRTEGNYGNVHSVPEEVLAKMKERFEEYVMLEDTDRNF